MKKTALYIFAIILGISFAACSEEGESGGQIEKKATIVRIQAAININGDDDTPVKRSTKAAGEIDDSNTDYNEGKEPGNNAENKVSTARLVAFDPLTGAAVKNTLYRLPGESLGSGEKHFTFEASPGKMNLSLDMEIMSGSYIFVLITNEEATWNLGAATNHSELMNAASNFLNPIVTVDDLNNKVAQKSGIPMIGQAGIQVKANSNATADNPQIVAPKIELERTLVKVEVSIRNTDDGTNVIETAKPYKIKSATLIYGNLKYNLFEENNASVTEEYSDYVSNVTHTAGALFTKQNIFTGYIAERKGITEDKATKVRIVATANETDYEYDIPLFQYEDAAKTKKNYDMRRNTIYRLGTRLEGKELGFGLDVFTEVEGWVDVDEAIVEVNDPYVEHVLNVDRRIIYVTPATSGNYTETITFFTDLEYIDHSTNISGLMVNDGELNAGTYAFALTIPKNAVSSGNKSIKFNFGLNGEKKADITIMVKPKQ